VPAISRKLAKRYARRRGWRWSWRWPDSLRSSSRIRCWLVASDARGRSESTSLSFGTVLGPDAGTGVPHVLTAFQTGIGRPRVIMAFNLIGLAAKIPLNMLYVFGLGLGAAGFAAATATIAWMTAVLSWGWCSRNPTMPATESSSASVDRDWPPLVELARTGLPIGATFLVDVTAFTSMALFIARLGPIMSAAHQIASNLAILCFMLPMSIGHASLVVCGHALGAGDRQRARHAAIIGLAVGTTASLTLACLLFVGAEFLAGLYTGDPAVREIAAGLIAIVAFYHVADGSRALQSTCCAVTRRRRYRCLFMLWRCGESAWFGGYLLGLD